MDKRWRERTRAPRGYCRACQIRPSSSISYNGGSACARSLRAARAKVAELVDALDLGSSGVTREGSSPSFRMFY